MQKQLNLSDAQKVELQGLIENEAQELISMIEEKKEELSLLAEAAGEAFGLKKSLFIKIAKVYYKASIDEETEKALVFKQLYLEATGEV